MAEDLVQETFARAWSAWRDLRDPALAKAWLMTILRNERVRLYSRKQIFVHVELDEDQMPSVPSIEAGLEIAQIVALLPETYREPLLLQVLGGFSCAEIADMLGTTEGAVMTRLTRARQSFRQHFSEAGKMKIVK